MTLSIIIPVYNVEAYVGQCLQSILHDGSPVSEDFEIIVVNDGSQDNSMNEVEQLCQGRNNITIIHQNNQGLSSARMFGLSHASGDYVWFIDSDDYVKDDSIKKIIGIIKSCRGSYDLIMMPLSWSYANSSLDHLDYSINEDLILNGRDILRAGNIPVWGTPRYIISRSLFCNDSISFPLNHLHEDEYFGRVVLYLSNKVFVLKESFYIYRQREGSIMSMLSIKSSYDIVSLYRLLNHFCANIVHKEDKYWFHKNIVSFLLQSYKKVPHLHNEQSFRAFRQKNARYILLQEHSIKEYSLKERFWLTVYIISPRIHAQLVARLIKKS